MEFPPSKDASFKSASISYYFGSFDVGTFLVVESPFYLEPLFWDELVKSMLLNFAVYLLA
jgi:hypothetical protein